MKNFLAGFRPAGGFIAGLLIGLSIMIPLSQMIQTDPGDRQMVWIFGALIVLALGLKVHAISALKPHY